MTGSENKLTDDEYDAFVGGDASYARKPTHYQDLCFIGRKQRPKFYFSVKQVKNVTCKRCLKMLKRKPAPEEYVVRTQAALLDLLLSGKAKEGDICECEENKTTFIFRNGGWTAIKTKQKGYEHLYGHEIEQ